MNGHEKRRQRLIARIKESALELFTASGADEVSMDDIAARAQVSKVTIYKYFHSKGELRRQVVNLYLDQLLVGVERLLEGDQDFLEKLEITWLAQLNSLKVAGSQALFDLLEEDSQDQGAAPGSLNRRIRDIMFRFYQEGRRAGYIEPGLSFDLLNLFSEIFQAGFKAKSMQDPDFTDAQTLEQLVHLCFFGIIRRN